MHHQHKLEALHPAELQAKLTRYYLDNGCIWMPDWSFVLVADGLKVRGLDFSSVVFVMYYYSYPGHEAIVLLSGKYWKCGENCDLNL